MKYHNKKQIVKYEGVIYAAMLIIGIVCLSKCSGVGKLDDDKLQAGNDVVRLIYKYNKSHKRPCQSLSELGLKPVGDNYYEYKVCGFYWMPTIRLLICDFVVHKVVT